MPTSKTTQKNPSPKVAVKSVVRVPPELEDLAEQVGSFIQYWGFKKIHGRIWTHLYLSKEPLDAGELIRRLKVSKALMSFSINDLLEYEVIQEAGKGKRGTVFYRANPDIAQVIVNVLRGRERRMLSRIMASHKLLKESGRQAASELKLDSDRVVYLGEMILSAEKVLDAFVALGDRDQADVMQCFESMIPDVEA